MKNNYFNVHNVRFHQKNASLYIIQGWRIEDDGQLKDLKVTADDRELQFEIEKRTGLDVRRKYVTIDSKIDTEYTLTVTLPDNIYDYHRLMLLDTADGDENICWSKKTQDMFSEKEHVDFNIDSIQVEDELCIIRGWAATDGPARFQIQDKKGNDVPFDLKRGNRHDVAFVYPELDDPELGFLIKLKNSRKKYNLFIYNREKKAVYGIDTTASLKGKGFIRKAVKKTLWNLKVYGLKATIKKILLKLTGSGHIEVDYDKWMAKNMPSQDELDKQRKAEFSYQPKFSIVVPLFKTPERYLNEMVESVRKQTYSNWELCLSDGSGQASPIKGLLNQLSSADDRIKVVSSENPLKISDNTNMALKEAKGDYIAFMDHDDLLAENALYECVKVLNDKKDTDIIYTDEDKVSMNGKQFFQPHFKSDFNIDLLCSMNYICHLFIVKKEVLDKVGLLDPDYDGAQDYDLILRCVDYSQKIHHIPKILYHWRAHVDSTAENPESKMYAFEAGARAVESHYTRLGIEAKVEKGQYLGLYRTQFTLKDEPLVSIIIPNKDHIDDLHVCLHSIIHLSNYKNYEILIVENNSTEEATFLYYKELEERFSNVKVIYYKGDFNYSRINNFGAAHAQGEYLLLLNNDTEMINGECLEEMLGYCTRKDVGIVGARLLYKDDTIQHAGTVIGFGGIAGHAFIGMENDENGYFSRIICAQDYSAVTAACLMVKKSVFDEVGGLTEEFKVAFNDVDFCLKVRSAGKLVVYNPYAMLYHYESKSRGLEDTPEKIERFQSEIARFAEKWPDILKNGDPYYNPNLTLDKADFSLRI